MSFITTRLNVGYNFTDRVIFYPNWARPVVLGRESPKAHGSHLGLQNGLNRTRVVERIFLPSTSSSN